MVASRAYPRARRSPLMLRDGRVHVGTWERAATNGERHDLTEATGLVEAAPRPEHHPVTRDDNPYAPALSDTYSLTLLGRPDIQVGDVVSAALPAGQERDPNTAAGVLGALGGLGVLAAPVVSAVVGSRHDARCPRLPGDGRRARHTPRPGGLQLHHAHRRRCRQRPAEPAPSTEAARVAEAVDGRMREAVSVRRAVEVGVVSRQTVAASGTNRPRRPRPPRANSTRSTRRTCPCVRASPARPRASPRRPTSPRSRSAAPGSSSRTTPARASSTSTTRASCATPWSPEPSGSRTTNPEASSATGGSPCRSTCRPPSRAGAGRRADGQGVDDLIDGHGNRSIRVRRLRSPWARRTSPASAAARPGRPTTSS